MAEMTSRERVMRTIDLKEPDRVPIDFGGVVSGIVNGEPYGYEALCEYLGIGDPETPQINSRLNCVQNVDERILKRFNADIRHLNMGGRPLEELPSGLYRDMWGIILKQSGMYKSIPDQLAPLREATTMEEIEDYEHWPDPQDPSFTEGKREEARYLHEETDYAVFSHPGYAARVFHMYAALRGFDKWMTDMKMNPEFYHRFAEKILEVAIEVTETFYDQVADFTDVAVYYDDMGMQSGGFVSVQDYREFNKPYTAEYLKAAKEASGGKFYYHTCGSVYSYMNDIIEMGVDVLNPIQPLAKNMAPQILQEEFGDQICFHGGIDEQELLPFATPDEISSSVKETAKILAPGGGWIFAPAHNIQPDTPPENIVAMYDSIAGLDDY